MRAASLPRVTAADLSAALSQRVDDIAPRLFPAARRSGRYWHIGDIEGHKGDSLFIHARGSRAGSWQDAATGAHGDLLDLAAAAMRTDLRGAMDWARGFLGISDEVPWIPPPPDYQRADDDTTAGRREAREIWASSKPAGDTLAETYLRARAINLPPPPSLRYHGATIYQPSGVRLPALIAAVSGPDKRVTAIQRIYLRTDGTGKAGVRVPKMSRGSLGNGAVRLALAGEALGLAEGVETALSAMEINGIPTWAALGTRFDAIAIPETVTRLTIFADNGDAGERAAERAIKVHQHIGRYVDVRFPQFDLKDWNDVAQMANGERF